MPSIPRSRERLPDMPPMGARGSGNNLNLNTSGGLQSKGDLAQQSRCEAGNGT
jgi:hypothetical protein